MKRVWITGSTGYLGGKFVSEWKRLFPGVEAVLLVRDAARAAPGFSAVAPADSRAGFAAAELSRLRDTHPPDAIVHFATHFLNAYSPAEADAMLDANVGFPVRMLEACRGLHGLKFLNFGSFYSHAEGSLDRPMTFYAASKRAFETFLNFYVDSLAAQAITLKLYDTYGPDDLRPKLIPKFLDLWKKDGSLDVSPGDQKLNLVHVDDVVSAAAQALRRLQDRQTSGRSEHEIFQLSATLDPARLPSLKEVADEFSRAAGRPLALNFGALPYREREIMVPAMPFERLPGWEPAMTLAEGFRQLLAFETKPNA